MSGKTTPESRRRWKLANRDRVREYSRQYEKSHRPSISFTAKKMRRRRRIEVLVALGGKCVVCGFSDYRALQVDHVNGGGTKERVSLGMDGFYRKVLKSIGNGQYQLLCANHNWIKKYEQGESRCED